MLFVFDFLGWHSALKSLIVRCNMEPNAWRLGVFCHCHAVDNLCQYSSDASEQQDVLDIVLVPQYFKVT